MLVDHDVIGARRPAADLLHHASRRVVPRSSTVPPTVTDVMEVTFGQSNSRRCDATRGRIVSVTVRTVASSPQYRSTVSSNAATRSAIHLVVVLGRAGRLRALLPPRPNLVGVSSDRGQAPVSPSASRQPCGRAFGFADSGSARLEQTLAAGELGQPIDVFAFDDQAAGRGT